jgi:hypothetical protein
MVTENTVLGDGKFGLVEIQYSKDPRKTAKTTSG